MRILAVLAAKGGTGKTTTAAALAVEAARRDHRVGLGDLDGGQRSLTTWWALRVQGLNLGEKPIDLVRPEADHPTTLRKAATSPFDVVIIDGLPGDIDVTATAVAAADFILVPSQPSPLDTLAMDAVVELATGADKPLAFVLNRTRPRLAVTAEARGDLAQLGDVLVGEVADRQGYASAMVDGRTWPELEKVKHHPAADEIAALWNAVEKRLKKAAARMVS